MNWTTNSLTSNATDMEEGKERANIKRNPPAKKLAGPPPSPGVDPRKAAFESVLDQFREDIARVIQEHIEMFYDAIDDKNTDDRR